MRGLKGWRTVERRFPAGAQILLAVLALTVAFLPAAQVKDEASARWSCPPFVIFSEIVENRSIRVNRNELTACRSAGWDAAAQTTTYQYDGQGRLTGVDYPDGRHAVYSYDGAGNRLSEEETVPAAGGGVRVVKQRAFAYDDRNRLVAVRDGLTPGRSVRYAHNGRGAVVSRTTGELDASGEILPGTETGRLSLTWDAAGQLRRVVRETPGNAPVTLEEYAYL